MSMMTYGELCFGAEKSSRRDTAISDLAMFLEAVPVLAMETEVSGCYARLRHDLQRRGLPIGTNDTWIAAHCLQLGLTLVTNKKGTFKRIPNLTIENWTH